MKPIIKYRGGKSKEVPNIIPHIPEFNGRYIEPFFGGGALFFYLEPPRAIINDINYKLINFYKGVKNDISFLQKELRDLEMLYNRNRLSFDKLKKQSPIDRVNDDNESLYYEIRDMFNDLKTKKYTEAALYYYINKTAYSGMIRYNAKGEFNVPYGRYKNFNTSIITEEHSRLLSNTEIYNLDYQKIFDMAEANDFMFLDPPYDCVFSDYGNDEYKDGFGDEAHEILSERFKSLPCKALLVIGKTPLTERLYGDLIIDEYEKKYAVNIRNRFKSTASHILVANY